MEPVNRVGAFRIYVQAPAESPAASKLYNALIQLDAQFCLNKVNGSIQLHYSQGTLSKIHRNEVI